ncbi:MAG: hypothetical protein U0174_20080 [Polyangiaceae bacterium]
MRFDFTSEVARRQYEATQAFAEAFRGEPAPPHLAQLPQVLVTGFGRFLHHADNASGHLVSALVPTVKYPRTSRGDESQVDLPEPQFARAWHEAVLPSGKHVALCGMIVPVQWGLGPALLAKQCASMSPAFVMMNGIAGAAQPLWLERGAANVAAAKVDGTGLLRPVELEGGGAQPLVPGAPPALPCFASFDELRAAADEEILSAIAERPEENLGDVLPGALLQVAARADNRYLCNELTFAACRLFRETKTPFVFLHWPSSMTAPHIAVGTRVLTRLVDVELSGTTKRSAGVAP